MDDDSKNHDDLAVLVASFIHATTPKSEKRTSHRSWTLGACVFRGVGDKRLSAFCNCWHSFRLFANRP